MDIRVKVIHNGEAWLVDLPQYSMIPGTFQPTIPDVVTSDGVLPKIDPNDPRLRGLSCVVSVPERILNSETGRPDIASIRALYRGQPKWDTPGRVINTEE